MLISIDMQRICRIAEGSRVDNANMFAGEHGNECVRRRTNVFKAPLNVFDGVTYVCLPLGFNLYTALNFCASGPP